ncbi:MAG: ARMT1-like domain-containing protein [Desulforhopalus sp.]
MRTDVECLPCLLRQALQVARITNCSGDQQLHIAQAVCLLIAKMDVEKSPPANAGPIYQKIAQITSCEDPYYNKKSENNEQAMKIVSCLRREIGGSDQELSSAVRFTIAGNIIDYGAFENFDIEAALKRCRTAQLAVDHLAYFFDALNRLRKGSTLLYLADNCGEIVYDSLLIENLYRRGFEIVIAVKDGPIINDALVEDALFAGLDKYGRIITNGCRYPGTELDECSEQFLDIFNSADLVIAKGQGNFESLSEVDRPIFFLLTIKCPVAARHMSVLNGLSADKLAGKGEMAVYYSGKDKLKGGSNEDTH